MGLLWAACGRAAESTDISVFGVDGEQRDNLIMHLGELDQRVLANSRRLSRRVHEAVSAALEPYGYYRAQTSASYNDGKLEIQIEPGNQVVWAEPQVKLPPAALAIREIDTMVREHPFIAGRGINHRLYDDYRENLYRAVWRLGFFDAHYTRRDLNIDIENGTATPILDLDAGERFRFGKRIYSGSHIDNDLLESLADFDEGEPFNNERVLEFDRRLRDTNYFKSSVVQVARRDNHVADIEVLLDDNNSSRYEVGAGFSTDANLRLRLNRHTPLINRRGHSLMIESEWSEPRQTLEAVYRIPRSNPLDDRYELTLGVQNKDIEDTELTKTTAGVFHALRFREHWNLTWGASYDYELYTIGNDPEETANYLLPAVILSRKRLQPGIDPMSGSYYWASADFSTDSLGSKTDFVRLRGGAKWLFGLGDNNTTILARAEGGTIFTDSFDAIPASLRYYAGGDNSVRGYDIESLAPRDSDGDIIGGRYLAVGSLEISRRIYPSWRVAAFVDSGAAFNDEDDRMYQSVGVGLRWLSPIGQIRLDLAFPVEDSDGGDYQLHISMGPPL